MAIIPCVFEMKPGGNMGRAAFTLVEVLVSVVILALMLIMLAGVFDVYNRSYTRSTSNMQTYDDVRSIVSMISHDISAAMVRTNANRTLNFSVTNDGDGTRIFMAVPDPKLQSLTNMSFVSHIAYFWQTNTCEVYRAIYNTQVDNTLLMNTAGNSSNTSTSANMNRLQNMTLAYLDGASGNPFSWTSDAAMVNAMNSVTNLPILKNVFSFNVLCYPGGASIANNVASTNQWGDAANLPRYLKLQFGVANEKDAATLRRNPGLTNLLENFEVTVPMMNYGVTNNIYAPQQ